MPPELQCAIRGRLVLMLQHLPDRDRAAERIDDTAQLDVVLRVGKRNRAFAQLDIPQTESPS